MRCSRSLTAALAAMTFAAAFAFVHRADAFTSEECVTRWTHDVDLKFRLPKASAQTRCTVIAGRITQLSRQIIGKWAQRGSHGIDTMSFTPDGLVRVHEFNFGSQSIQDTVQKWSFENPYGTVGSESLTINDGPMSAADFKGRVMTIRSQPADAEIVERWRRVSR